MDRINIYLDNLPLVLDNNGGTLAKKPSSKTIENCIEFIHSLPSYYQKIITPEECITATPYGTITIDWYYRKNFLSVEIGETKIGWFSEIPDGSNSSSDGITIVESPPSDIIKSLDKIYNRKEFNK